MLMKTKQALLDHEPPNKTPNPLKQKTTPALHYQSFPLILTLILQILISCPPLPSRAESQKSSAQDESFFSHSLPAQSGPKWQVRYRVIFPKNYQPQQIHSVVYFLHGRGGNRFNLEELGVLQKLDGLVEKHGKVPFIIIAPECNNCYWMNAALIDEPWGDVVTQDLIEDVEKKFLVYHQPQGRLLSGISMGGHGALQLALNFPLVFGAVAAHSPVFRTQEEATRDFSNQFGTGDLFQQRDPFSLLLFKNKHLNIPVWIDIGGSDFAFRNTQNFANLIQKLGFQGELHIGDDQRGAHSTGYWSYHLGTYLEWYWNQLSKSCIVGCAIESP